MTTEPAAANAVLGVLLAGHKKNAYWYGSQLSVQEARQLAGHALEYRRRGRGGILRVHG